MVSVSQNKIGLERMLDYRGIGLQRFHCISVETIKQNGVDRSWDIVDESEDLVPFQVGAYLQGHLWNAWDLPIIFFFVKAAGPSAHAIFAKTLAVISILLNDTSATTLIYHTELIIRPA